MLDADAPKSLQDFQLSYGHYLRDPSACSRPDGVPVRRSEIYENLLISNISGFINTCFPVAKSLHTQEQWQALCRAFFSEWRCTTPIFGRIPEEFVCFLNEYAQHSEVAPWLPELIHYEWVELDVDLDEAELPSQKDIDIHSSLFLNPTARLLAYQWPVHSVSKDALPTTEQQTCLVVYRDEEENVRFNEVNPTTFMLLQFINEHNAERGADASNKDKDIDSLLLGFSEQINHPDPSVLMVFGKQLIEDLKNKSILFGE